MITDDELRALAALAEAATPGPWEHQPYRDEMVGDVAQSQPGGATITTIGDADWTYANGRFIAEASPDVVRELVARVLKAEAIVRDLAASKGYYDGQSCRCVLCGESTSPSGPRNGYPDDHLLVCPWRRAVEAKLS